MDRPHCGNFQPVRRLTPTAAGKMDPVLAPMETVWMILDLVESSSRRPPSLVNGFVCGEPTAKPKFAVPKFNFEINEIIFLK